MTKTEPVGGCSDTLGLHVNRATLAPPPWSKGEGCVHASVAQPFFLWDDGLTALFCDLACLKEFNSTSLSLTIYGNVMALNIFLVKICYLFFFRFASSLQQTGPSRRRLRFTE